MASSECLACSNELCNSVLAAGSAVDDSFSEVNRQESGIFEGSDEFSDYCFSDNDIECNSEEDEVISDEENDNLWEVFQQSTFWSPPCSIKPCYTPPSCEIVEDEAPLVKLSSGHKRVTFKPDNELVTIHSMVTWDYAYRACRRGPWEQMAQDRLRFARRIEEVGLVLEPCLKRLMNQTPTSD